VVVTSVVISVSGRDMVYTVIHELAYGFWGSTTSCIPRLSDQILHHSLGETSLIFHIQKPVTPLNVPMHSRVLLAAILSWLAALYASWVATCFRS